MTDPAETKQAASRDSVLASIVMTISRAIACVGNDRNSAEVVGDTIVMQVGIVRRSTPISTWKALPSWMVKDVALHAALALAIESDLVKKTAIPIRKPRARKTAAKSS